MSQSRFTSVFKETYGELPTEYRRRKLEGLSTAANKASAFRTG